MGSGKLNFLKSTSSFLFSCIVQLYSTINGFVYIQSVYCVYGNMILWTTVLLVFTV